MDVSQIYGITIRNDGKITMLDYLDKLTLKNKEIVG
jgi:hypothetical protein